MPYIGMLAIHAQVIVHWESSVVAASVVIAVVAATAAFWILFRFLALYPVYESLRVLSSLVAALAVCGMHYTGMEAATYTVSHDPPSAMSGITISQGLANRIVVVCALLIAWVSSMIIQTELRRWHAYLHQRLKSSRKILEQLHLRYDSDLMLLDYESKEAKMTSTWEVDRDRGCTSAPRRDMHPFSTRPGAKVHLLEEGSGALDEENYGGEASEEGELTLHSFTPTPTPTTMTAEE